MPWRMRRTHRNLRKYVAHRLGISIDCCIGPDEMYDLVRDADVTVTSYLRVVKRVARQDGDETRDRVIRGMHGPFMIFPEVSSPPTDAEIAAVADSIHCSRTEAVASCALFELCESAATVLAAYTARELHRLNTPSEHATTVSPPSPSSPSTNFEKRSHRAVAQAFVKGWAACMHVGLTLPTPSQAKWLLAPLRYAGIFGDATYLSWFRERTFAQQACLTSSAAASAVLQQFPPSPHLDVIGSRFGVEKGGIGDCGPVKRDRSGSASPPEGASVGAKGGKAVDVERSSGGDGVRGDGVGPEGGGDDGGDGGRGGDGGGGLAALLWVDVGNSFLLSEAYSTLPGTASTTYGTADGDACTSPTHSSQPPHSSSPSHGVKVEAPSSTFAPLPPHPSCSLRDPAPPTDNQLPHHPYLVARSARVRGLPRSGSSSLCHGRPLLVGRSRALADGGPRGVWVVAKVAAAAQALGCSFSDAALVVGVPEAHIACAVEVCERAVGGVARTGVAVGSASLPPPSTTPRDLRAQQPSPPYPSTSLRTTHALSSDRLYQPTSPISSGGAARSGTAKPLRVGIASVPLHVRVAIDPTSDRADAGVEDTHAVIALVVATAESGGGGEVHLQGSGGGTGASPAVEVAQRGEGVPVQDPSLSSRSSLAFHCLLIDGSGHHRGGSVRHLPLPFQKRTV